MADRAEETKKPGRGRRKGEGWQTGRPRLPGGPVVKTRGAALTQVEVDDLEVLIARWALGPRGHKEAIRRAIRLARANVSPRSSEEES